MLIYSVGIIVSFFIVLKIFPEKLTGVFAFLLNIFFNCTIFIKLKEAIEKRSNEYINMSIVIMSFLCCISWLAFSIIILDIFIFIPNFVGFIAFGLNFVVYFWNEGRLSEENWIIELLKKLLKVEDEKTNISNNLYKIFREDSVKL